MNNSEFDVFEMESVDDYDPTNIFLDQEYPTLLVADNTLRNYELIFRRISKLALDRRVSRGCSVEVSKGADSEVCETRLTPIELVEALCAYTRIGNRTAITYVSALKFHLRNELPSDEIDAAWERLIRLVKELKSQAIAIRDEAKAIRKKKINPIQMKFPVENGRDRLKPRVVPEEDWEYLLQELSARHNNSSYRKKIKKTPRDVFHWLWASYITGLRPSEWLTAIWEDQSQSILKVKSAKSKRLTSPLFRSRSTDCAMDESRLRFESSNAEPKADSQEDDSKSGWRKIPIASQLDRRIVNEHMRLFHSQVFGDPNCLDDTNGEIQVQQRFEEHRHRCQRYLQRLCVQKWGNRPEKSYKLYNGRGTFSANMKSLYGLERTADLMGHCRSDTPASRSYGTSGQAHSKFVSTGQGQGPKLKFKDQLVQKGLTSRTNQRVSVADIQQAVESDPVLHENYEVEVDHDFEDCTVRDRPMM